MAKNNPKKEDSKAEKPGVHKDLEGFEIKINEFGEVTTSFDVDRVNEFLNKNLEDKKLKSRDEEE
ncbi:hypothetical protein [Phaeodactylibacter luteus]|uniref:Uncharacterized protein n=1 Tax=Phaeodactylibacter luteus TaxID=1564516 RepID=A0A5C6RLQ4_9BACT|nr:hypothetical protein [Phaeodactylibacter luteus]TXB63167.1 hypothetical protein FRY97_10180 [Phaeodactylibacter luteus]